MRITSHSRLTTCTWKGRILLGTVTGAAGRGSRVGAQRAAGEGQPRCWHCSAALPQAAWQRSKLQSAGWLLGLSTSAYQCRTRPFVTNGSRLMKLRTCRTGQDHQRCMPRRLSCRRRIRSNAVLMAGQCMPKVSAPSLSCRPAKAKCSAHCPHLLFISAPPNQHATAQHARQGPFRKAAGNGEDHGASSAHQCSGQRAAQRKARCKVGGELHCASMQARFNWGSPVNWVAHRPPKQELAGISLRGKANLETSISRRSTLARGSRGSSTTWQPGRAPAGCHSRGACAAGQHSSTVCRPK